MFNCKFANECFQNVFATYFANIELGSLVTRVARVVLNICPPTLIVTQSCVEDTLSVEKNFKLLHYQITLKTQM